MLIPFSYHDLLQRDKWQRKLGVAIGLIPFSQNLFWIGPRDLDWPWKVMHRHLCFPFSFFAFQRNGFEEFSPDYLSLISIFQVSHFLEMWQWFLSAWGIFQIRIKCQRFQSLSKKVWKKTWCSTNGCHTCMNIETTHFIWKSGLSKIPHCFQHGWSPATFPSHLANERFFLAKNQTKQEGKTPTANQTCFVMSTESWHTAVN